MLSLVYESSFYRCAGLPEHCSCLLCQWETLRDWESPVSPNRAFIEMAKHVWFEVWALRAPVITALNSTFSSSATFPPHNIVLSTTSEHWLSCALKAQASGRSPAEIIYSYLGTHCLLSCLIYLQTKISIYMSLHLISKKPFFYCTSTSWIWKC